MGLSKLEQQINLIKQNFNKDMELNTSDLKLFLNLVKKNFNDLSSQEAKELTKKVNDIFSSEIFFETLSELLELFIFQLENNLETFNFKFCTNLIELKTFCEQNGHRPSMSGNANQKRLNKFLRNNGNSRTDEELALIEKTISKYKKFAEVKTENEFNENLKALKEYCEEHNYLPHSRSSAYERKLYLFYRNETNAVRTEEQDEKINEIISKYGMQRETYEKENFMEMFKKLENFCNENGHLPSSGGDLRERALYKFYSNKKLKRNDELWSMIDEIVKKYNKKSDELSKISFDQNYKNLVEFCKENSILPTYNENEKERLLYHFYLNSFKKARTDEQNLKIEEIGKKYDQLKNIDYSKKVTNIYGNIEKLVEDLAIKNKTTNIVTIFADIEKSFDLFYINEKKLFEKQNPEIMNFYNHVVKQNYTKFSNDVQMEIIDSMYEIVQDYKNLNNNEITGDYIAWNLNKELYLKEEGEKEDDENILDIRKDLSSLQRVLKYLKFKNQTKKARDRIIGGFNLFLEHIDFRNSDIDKQTESAYKAEMLSHISLFFENFNPEDFNEMMKSLKGKSEAEFVDVILTNINNSALVIPRDKNETPSNVFEKGKDGRWYYDMKTSGILDNHYSYNGRRITGSVTTSDTNGWEGGQLLFHPMKDKLLSNDIYEFIKGEIVLGRYKDPQGFKKDSPLYGLKIKDMDKNFIKNNGIEKNLDFEISNKEAFLENKLFNDKELFEKQLVKMDNGLLLTKVLLESNIGRRKDSANKFDNLNKFREKVVITSKNGYNDTLEEYKKIIHGQENANLTNEDLQNVAKGHIFTLRSLTLGTLSTEENEMLIELYLNTEKKVYEKWMDKELTDTFIQQIDVKNPLVKSSINTIMENNNKDILGELLIDFLLQEGLKIEATRKQDIDKEFVSKLIHFHNNNSEKYDLPEFSSIFFEKMTTNKYSEMFVNIISDAYKTRKISISKFSTKDNVQKHDEIFLQNVKHLTHKGEDITTIYTTTNEIEPFFKKILIKLINAEGADALNDMLKAYTSSQLIELFETEIDEITLKKEEIDKIFTSLKENKTSGNQP